MATCSCAPFFKRVAATTTPIPPNPSTRSTRYFPSRISPGRRGDCVYVVIEILPCFARRHPAGKLDLRRALRHRTLFLRSGSLHLRRSLRFRDETPAVRPSCAKCDEPSWIVGTDVGGCLLCEEGGPATVRHPIMPAGQASSRPRP